MRPLRPAVAAVALNLPPPALVPHGLTVGTGLDSGHAPGPAAHRAREPGCRRPPCASTPGAALDAAHDPAPSPPGAKRNPPTLAFVGWTASSSPPCRMQRTGRAPSATAPGRHTGQAVFPATARHRRTRRPRGPRRALRRRRRPHRRRRAQAHRPIRPGGGGSLHPPAPRRASRLTTSAGAGFRKRAHRSMRSRRFEKRSDLA